MHHGIAYVGIDLASDPKLTGIACLRDEGGKVVVEDVQVGADDDTIVSAVMTSRKTGVDVPFGWPRTFVELLEAHRTATLAPPPSTDPDWKRQVLYRATDLEVRRRVGKNPLSVASDKIAYPAIRWAGIAARLREQGVPVSPDGHGVACEVYPGAALIAWQLEGHKYKGKKGAASRAGLVKQLSARLPWLDWAGHRGACVDDDNALDAVIAAVVARDVDRGLATPPPAELADLAAEEGWIWLPEELQ
ncbi:DUF429 domain-containing protein [Brachybacterium tyrofermentans]|uniref:DUF429 domain-containing protein n=1 Tax=Brachybacterium tyrofermentans TaxID=47848 RepID=UPI003FD64AFE